MTENIDKQWNNYLKVYQDRFKVKKDDCSLTNILCKGYNFVSLFSVDSKLLLFHFESKKIHYGLFVLDKKLKSRGTWYKISQQGDYGMVIVFKEEDLNKVVDIFEIRQKKVLNPEYKALLTERLRKIREGK